MISSEEGKLLVKLARQSIETFFSGKIISMREFDKFTEKLGVFVTLMQYGKLRGCIGYPEPVYELNRAIIESARAAAFRDPRFPPVSEEELEDITIEVSILTKPKLIEIEKAEEYLDKIKVGKHGLIIKAPYHSGLLLPQVLKESECTPKQALEMTCEKAGLPDDAWMSKEAKIYTFSAKIFEEEEPNGQVIEKK